MRGLNYFSSVSIVMLILIFLGFIFSNLVPRIPKEQVDDTPCPKRKRKQQLLAMCNIIVNTS